MMTLRTSDISLCICDAIDNCMCFCSPLVDDVSIKIKSLLHQTREAILHSTKEENGNTERQDVLASHGNTKTANTANSSNK